MDKISKLISKIPKKDAIKIADSIEKLINGKTSNLDIKKLKGFQDIFRVRVGNYRVIYKTLDKGINILEIAKRKEDTYKSY